MVTGRRDCINNKTVMRHLGPFQKKDNSVKQYDHIKAEIAQSKWCRIEIPFYDADDAVQRASLALIKIGLSNSSRFMNTLPSRVQHESSMFRRLAFTKLRASKKSAEAIFVRFLPMKTFRSPNFFSSRRCSTTIFRTLLDEKDTKIGRGKPGLEETVILV